MAPASLKKTEGIPTRRPDAEGLEAGLVLPAPRNTRFSQGEAIMKFRGNITARPGRFVFSEVHNSVYPSLKTAWVGAGSNVKRQIKPGHK